MYYYREQRRPPQGQPQNYYYNETQQQYKRVQPELPKYGPIYPTRPHEPPPSYQPQRQQQPMYPMRPHYQQQRKDMGFEEFYKKLTELERQRNLAEEGPNKEEVEEVEQDVEAEEVEEKMQEEKVEEIHEAQDDDWDDDWDWDIDAWTNNSPEEDDKEVEETKED